MAPEGKTPSAQGMKALCVMCLEPLTDTEIHYYGFRCEACEREQMERVFAWRGGAEDTELDARYAGPKNILH